MTKKQSRKTASTNLEDEVEAVQLISYEITEEPIEEPAYRRLPRSVKNKLEELHFLSQTNPDDAIPQLLRLLKRYPKVPQIYNYLSAAYSVQGDTEKMEEMAQENLRKNPNYLFARLNQAQIFLQNQEYDKIPDLFDHKYDLKLLYPNRSKFHISEVANFMGLMGLYFFETDRRDKAEMYNGILQEIAPDYPIAKMLDRRLNPGMIARALKRLMSK